MQLEWDYVKTMDMCGGHGKRGQKYCLEVKLSQRREETVTPKLLIPWRPGLKKYDRGQRGEKRVSSGERECRIEKHRDFWTC